MCGEAAGQETQARTHTQAHTCGRQVLEQREAVSVEAALMFPSCCCYLPLARKTLSQLCKASRKMEGNQAQQLAAPWSISDCFTDNSSVPVVRITRALS